MARRGERTSVVFRPTAECLERVIAQAAAPGSGSAVEPQARRDALACYRALPYGNAPTLKSWRHEYAQLDFDSLRWTTGRLALPNFRLPQNIAPVPAEPAGDRPALATETSYGVVHVGATYYYDPEAPAETGSATVVAPLSDARAAFGSRVPSLAAFDEFGSDPFAQLALAFQNCGAFISVPAGCVLERPIQLLFMNAGVEADAEAVFPHVVVVLGEGARASIIERHLGDGQPFVCGLVAVHLQPNATLDYAVVQNAGEEARVLSHRAARCASGATMRWSDLELGGTLARTLLGSRLAGRDASAQTSALFLNTGLQHVDLTTTTDHLASQTVSKTVVRSAATDLGQGRYFGKIAIGPDAHGADASLRGDALLLSKRAQIESIPVLEIETNDVRAAHGATVGSLDAEALFYVQSRGIARADAVRMIALAFFEPAIASFPGDVLRDEIRTALDRQIDEATDINA